MTSREFDAIIFGATGYTGRYVIEELAQTAKSRNIKWAVAGRNVEKVKESIDIVQGYLGDEIDISKITIIKADVKDASSISEMCKRTRVILNCVGPYKFFGEVVVKACIENGTHHVDLSGEMQYLDMTQANYFKAAREKGVYIVGACGFDSIPGDYGISLLKKRFPGDINSVEYFVQVGQGPSGRSTNIGTFLSAVHSVTDFFRISQFDTALKKEVFKKDLMKSNYSLSKRLPPLFYSGEMKSWCLWFMGADERVIERSQKFRYEYLNERPWIPFVDPFLDKDNKFQLGGVAKDAYEGMKMLMDFNYQANQQPDNIYGVKINGTWNGMIGSMVDNETDISGPFLIDEDRSLAVEFSVPLAFSQLTIVSGMVSSNRNPFLILAVFSIPVWIALFLASLFVAAAACLIYQMLPAQQKRSIPETYSKYLWAFKTGLIGKDFGGNKRWFLQHVRSSPSFRLLQSLWFINVCVIIMYTYQGAIISAFAGDKLKPRISTIQELLDDTTMAIGTIKDAYPMAFFKRLVNTDYESIWYRMEKNLLDLPSKGTIPPLFDEVEAGNLVFIAGKVWCQTFIGQRFLKTGRCGLKTTDIELGATHLAFAFRKGLHNKRVFKNFNKVIRRFAEGNLKRHKLLTSLLHYEICTGEKVAVTDPLKLLDLAGAFFIFALGNILACILFIFELLKSSKYCFTK